MSRRRHTTYVELPPEQEPAEAAALLTEFICRAPLLGMNQTNKDDKPKRPLQPTAQELRRAYRREAFLDEPPASVSVTAIGREQAQLWRIATQVTPEQGPPPLSASMTVTNHEPNRRGAVIFTADSSPALPDEGWKAVIEAAQDALDLVSNDGRPQDVAPEVEEAQSLAELMAQHRFLMVVNKETDDLGANHLDEVQQMAKHATLGPATQMRLLRSMDPNQSTEWLKSEWVWLSREMYDPDGVHVRALPNDCAQAKQVAQEQIQNMMESTEFAAVRTLQRAVDQLAETMAQQPEQKTGPSDRDHQIQQRVNTLEDRAKEREQTLRQQQATIQRMSLELEALHTDGNRNGTRPSHGTEESTEHLDKIIMQNASRWPHLVIMKSLIESAASQHPCLPSGEEMIRVMDCMERLGQALTESEDEKVGTFANHFQQLTGWNYSRGESQTTMQRYGDQRWFNDSEEKRFCQRHLTKRGREHSTQIYFGKEPTIGLAIAYVGPHLSIVSRP